MDTKLVQGAFTELEADALIALSFEGDAASTINQATANWLEELVSAGEFKGKPGDSALLHRPAGLKARRLYVAGLGKSADLKSAAVRKAVGASVRSLKAKSLKNLTLFLEGAAATAEMVEAAVEGAILGNHESTRYKSKKDDIHLLESFNIAVAGSTKDLTAAFERGRIIAESQNFTRDLVDEPGNTLPPRVLAERAQAMAAEVGLECEVLDQDRMKQLGMGSLLGVAMGSAEPPAFIILRYKPAAAASSNDHLAIIGKGVTFDTGGISIKPADSMEKMKYDMAGGGAAIGAMRAIAQLKPAIPVTAFIPAVENMPGGKAVRPGDILTSLSGRTIEVLNTDAEGRLILVDAIEYAKRAGCTHMVDAATLTGAIVVALGHVHVGAFTNNDGMLARVMSASKAQGESMWHMPTDDEFKEYLKSYIADIPNIGGRWGGSVTAAMFLKEWAGDTPWVHLDIAGTAWLDDAKPHMAKGPSGICVRTFVHLAMNW